MIVSRPPLPDQFVLSNVCKICALQTQIIDLCADGFKRVVGDIRNKIMLAI